jgi:hypothetical protein
MGDLFWVDNAGKLIYCFRSNMLKHPWCDVMLLFYNKIALKFIFTTIPALCMTQNHRCLLSFNSGLSATHRLVQCSADSHLIRAQEITVFLSF